MVICYYHWIFWTKSKFPLDILHQRLQWGYSRSVLVQTTVFTVDLHIPLDSETYDSGVATPKLLTNMEDPSYSSIVQSPVESCHSSGAKEPCAVTDVQKWRDYLQNYFRLVTDHRLAVSIINSLEKREIRSNKIQRWRVKFSLRS